MKPLSNQILENFGSLLIEDVYDRVLKRAHDVLSGETKAQSLKETSLKLFFISEDEQKIVKDFIADNIAATLHYFLWMIEQSDDFDLVAIDHAENKYISLKEVSDGLCGEIYTENGWIEKYSKYPSTLE